MKKQLYVVLLIMTIGCAQSFALSPNWQWAKSTGGLSSDYATCVATDQNGNAYITGSYANNDAIFLTKYDSSGNVLWTTGFIGQGVGIGIACDANENVYVTGVIVGDSVMFGSFVLLNDNSPTAGPIFTVKYDSAGNVIWAKNCIGPTFYNTTPAGIAIDSNNNVYITGCYGGDVTFGGITLSGDGMFTVKYDSAGNVLWAKSPVTGGSSAPYSYGICLDASGDIYITGGFINGDLTFGAFTLTYHGTTSNSYDMFTVKYDSNGNVVWANNPGATLEAIGFGIATDHAKNSYVIGQFSDSSIVFGNTTLTNSGYSNFIVAMFVVKYDSSGNVLWAKNPGGSYYGNTGGKSIATDVNANIYVTGSFTDSSFIFGSDTLTNTNFSLSQDIFIFKCDSSGNALYAKSAGGNSEDGSVSIAADAFGNMYITGIFNSDSLFFGPIELHGNPGGYNKIYIAKLGNDITTDVPNLVSIANELEIFPNPFSNSTTISFSLPQSQKVSLKLFDMSGRLVSTLANKIFNAGENEMVWYAEDVNAGVYFLQFQSNQNFQTQKLIVTK